MTSTASSPAVATTPSLPSPFKARYEIRRLSEKDLQVALAIVVHTNVFRSPIFALAQPEGKQQRCYDGLRLGAYLIEHQIASGHSFGVFDTEYQYRTAEAAAQGGAVLWDPTKLDATAEELDDQIDSPMMSVAVSYDGFNHLDMARLAPLLGLLPLYGTIFGRLNLLDPRDEATFTAKQPGEILMRNGTSTRAKAEGNKIMKLMANWLMAYAKEQGYRAMNIECFNEAVDKVWANPTTSGVRAQRICAFHADEYTEVDADGKLVNPFAPATSRLSRVWVTLRE